MAIVSRDPMLLSGPRREPAREPVLALEEVTIGVVRRGQPAKPIVRGISLAVRPGERVGLIGESGSGKSVTALAVMGLLPKPLALLGGRIRFRGRDLTALPEMAWRALRGREMAIVFQDYSGSLHPLFPIGRQMVETIRCHAEESRAEARATALAALERVRLPAERVFRSYPFQLSGGQRQRVALAMAMMLQPKLLIADEPTTALDVVTSRTILDVLDAWQRETNSAVLLITHDLNQAAKRVNKVAVMYGGTVVEEGPAASLLERPRHPYTQLLLAARPRLDGGPSRLTTVPGEPGLVSERGCPFARRCPVRVEACTGEPAPRVGVGPGHVAACHLLAPASADAAMRERRRAGE